MTIQIRQIELHQIPEAKRLILSVARNIFQWPAPLDEIIQQFDARSELHDVDDVQAYYPEGQGQFLVAMDQGRVIGTGAIRRIDDDSAELKRLWLLEAYHDQGIGYQLLQALLSFARAAGYKRVRLLTDRRQTRAMRFYQRTGFQPIACDTGDPNDVCLEMVL